MDLRKVQCIHVITHKNYWTIIHKIYVYYDVLWRHKVLGSGALSVSISFVAQLFPRTAVNGFKTFSTISLSKSMKIVHVLCNITISKFCEFYKYISRDSTEINIKTTQPYEFTCTWCDRSRPTCKTFGGEVLKILN